MWQKWRHRVYASEKLTIDILGIGSDQKPREEIFWYLYTICDKLITLSIIPTWILYISKLYIYLYNINYRNITKLNNIILYFILYTFT